MVYFTLRPIYPPRKERRYPLNRRLDGPKTDRDFLEKENLLPSLWPETQARPAHIGSLYAVAYTGILFVVGGVGGCSTNSVEDGENGDLGAVAPQSGVLEAAVIWYKKCHFI